SNPLIVGWPDLPFFKRFQLGGISFPGDSSGCLETTRAEYFINWADHAERLSGDNTRTRLSRRMRELRLITNQSIRQTLGGWSKNDSGRNRTIFSCRR
ncbi:MAG: hypothetical protein VXZ38_00675, partial [Planctomycetota bacterium]|nr:hypothetical protein [Planctomycetota bacterium]